jgi:hypothetical protein
VERLDGPFWRPDGWSSAIRTMPFLESERMAFCSLDGICSTSGRELSSSGGRVILFVRTCVTVLLLSEAARVRTSSKHRPDGDPTEAINSPDRRSLSHTPQNPFFSHFVSNFLSLWSYLHVSSCAFSFHFRYFFLVSFLFQFIYFKLLESYFWNEVELI